MEENKNPLHVIIVDPDTKDANQSLGITDERARELIDYANKVFGATLEVNETLEYISKKCTHANELAWLCFMLGVNLQAKKNIANVPNQGLGGLPGKLFRDADGQVKGGIIAAEGLEGLIKAYMAIQKIKDKLDGKDGDDDKSKKDE